MERSRFSERHDTAGRHENSARPDNYGVKHVFNLAWSPRFFLWIGALRVLLWCGRKERRFHAGSSEQRARAWCTRNTHLLGNRAKPDFHWSRNTGSNRLELTPLLIFTFRPQFSREQGVLSRRSSHWYRNIAPGGRDIKYRSNLRGAFSSKITFIDETSWMDINDGIKKLVVL